MARPYSQAKNKMNYRKSQITMLMIVGLLLFIVVSFVLYLSKSAVKRQGYNSVKGVQQTAVDTLAIKNFVSNCVDKLTKESFLLLGNQGGYLYSSQGGTLIDYDEINDEGKFFVKYNGYNVVYNILPPKFESSYYTSKIPNYPWKTFPYNAMNNQVFDGYFGINNMPFLYSSQGPQSIQSQIESYIDNNIENCLGLDFLKNLSYDIEIKKSKTQVVIGSTNLNVNIDLPITVRNKNTKESFELRKFSSIVDLRLKDIYSYLKNMIDGDIKNIKFDITSAASPDLSINILKDIYSKDDIIIITDDNSLINGKPFQYVFARKNRAPALYYLSPEVLYFDSGYLIKEDDVLRGQKLNAEDPDEDALQFSIRALSHDSALPRILDVPELTFRVEVNDGSLIDYQDITVYQK